MSGLTTSSASPGRFVLTFLAALSLACGGKSSRVPIRPSGAPAPRTPAPAPAATVAPPGTRFVSNLAREPSIRVGLSTSARIVRLTSSRPFRIGAGAEWLEAQDVLVEAVSSGAAEGFVYLVKLGSFPAEEKANEFRTRVAEEIEGNLGIAREPGSGRYGVRLGSFPDEETARAKERGLREAGFAGTEVIREPAVWPSPEAIVLRAPERAVTRLPPAAVTAIPGESGAFLEVDGRPYRGYLEIFVNETRAFTVVNVVNLEDYLEGVVPAELSPEEFPEEEALKAQAIAARTYAVKRSGEFASEGYDLCATPACQVYRGVGVERRLSSKAVTDTAGEILTFQGEPIDALYTSTCGGRTENAENVFSSPQPYLVSRACLLEARAPEASARNDGALSLEAATLLRMGLVSDPSSVAPASRDEARRWTMDLMGHLGQKGCWREPDGTAVETFDVAALARLLAEALCWERRLPFLVSSFDAETMVGDPIAEADRLYLAYAVEEGLIVPDAGGIRKGAPLERHAVLEALYRVLSRRGEPPLRRASLVSYEPEFERLTLLEERTAGEKTEVSMTLSAVRYLYRSVDGSAFYSPRVTLLPNDRVRFHADAGGIDVLVVEPSGGSFDRSSRFSHWVVRKSADEIDREANRAGTVGEVLELRPRRYGASGRIVELEVVGSAGSVVLRGLAIRRTLGIRENLFFLDAQEPPDGSRKSWVFTGRGWGHGVGLCQVGAYGMAAAGYGYREILAHYYPGSAIGIGAASALSRSVDKKLSRP